MCDIYVPSVGYVCWECKDEFKEYLKSEGKTDLDKNDIRRELERFLNTTKGNFEDGGQMDVDDFFKEYDR